MSVEKSGPAKEEDDVLSVEDVAAQDMTAGT